MKTITSAELKELLKSAGVENPHLADENYSLMAAADLRKLNRLLSLVRLLPYKAQKRDCDDYAVTARAVCRLFFGNKAFGEIWANGISTTGAYHAANFYVDETKTIKLYEPQNAKSTDFKPTGDHILTIV